MRPEDNEELQEVIGRELDAIESGTYESMDALPAAVEAVAIQILRQRRVILACKYLDARVPTADLGDAKQKAEALCERERRR
jgi:hypothetical protein